MLALAGILPQLAMLVGTVHHFKYAVCIVVCAGDSGRCYHADSVILCSVIELGYKLHAAAVFFQRNCGVQNDLCRLTASFAGTLHEFYKTFLLFL